MSSVRTSAKVVLVTAACALALSACAGNSNKKPRLAYEERPVELLYSTGADRLDRRQWNQAVNYFQEVERQHPYSEWARKSLLMSAYAAYENGDYDECISSANRYVALHPGSPDAAYAQYLIAA